MSSSETTFRSYATAVEFKVVAVRDCPLPLELTHCERPDQAFSYWNHHVATWPHFNPECECMVVLLLNTRLKIKGHHLVATGTLDSICVHVREVFRPAIVAAAFAIVLMHNHPSGDPNPSIADIQSTRDFVRAGQLLKIRVCDHIIVTEDKHVSLRELGFISD